MPERLNQPLLAQLLDSWDRNNTILVNLCRGLPEKGLEARAMAGSPSVAEMFTHMHYVRLVFISEDAPEFAVPVPDKEWLIESDRRRIEDMLNESAKAVRNAIQSKVETGGHMKQHYDHPILFLQQMIWHEGYHHGQIKLALKAARTSMADDQAGPLTWDVWMDKS